MASKIVILLSSKLNSKWTNNLFRYLSKEKLYTAKICNHLRLYFSNWKSEEQILVYQMGKVGSTTVTKSLEALGRNYSIYHLHLLNREHLDWAEKYYKSNRQKYAHVPRQLLNGLLVRSQIDKIRNKKKVKIITLVRDPIARNVSKFFQVLHTQLDYPYQSKITTIGIKAVVQELIELFFNKKFYESEDWEHEHCSMPFSWFDTELKNVFDIDVFLYKFPKLKGYKIYENNCADVLLLKLENIKECAIYAFKEFLDIEKFSLVKKNLAYEKYYHEAYEMFLNNIHLPEDYLDKFYSSYQVRHFYTSDEIGNFKKRWR